MLKALLKIQKTQVHIVECKEWNGKLWSYISENHLWRGNFARHFQRFWRIRLPSWILATMEAIWNQFCILLSNRLQENCNWKIFARIKKGSFEARSLWMLKTSLERATSYESLQLTSALIKLLYDEAPNAWNFSTEKWKEHMIVYSWRT